VYCDRVLVLVRGRIAAELPGRGYDRTTLIAAIEGVAGAVDAPRSAVPAEAPPSAASAETGGAGRGAAAAPTTETNEPGEAQ
jgi:hypothetical protein